MWPGPKAEVIASRPKLIILDECTKDFLRTLRRRILLKYKNFSDFARASNIPASRVNAALNGYNLPRFDTLEAMAKALDYDLTPSFNYQYYHGLVDITDLKIRLRRRRLTLSKLGKKIGYSRYFLGKSLAPNSKVTSIRVIYAIVQYLDSLKDSWLDEDPDCAITITPLYASKKGK